jgi:hypothetical protein
MQASSAGSLSTGTKEDESSTWRVWAAGFYNVAARSCWLRVLKLIKVQFFLFPFFSSAVKRG